MKQQTWYIGFDPADCKYHPMAGEPLIGKTYTDLEECRAECRKKNIKSDRAWNQLCNRYGEDFLKQ